MNLNLYIVKIRRVCLFILKLKIKNAKYELEEKLKTSLPFCLLLVY